MRGLALRFALWLAIKCAKDKTWLRHGLIQGWAGKRTVILNARFTMPNSVSIEPLYPEEGESLIVGNWFRECRDCRREETHGD